MDVHYQGAGMDNKLLVTCSLWLLGCLVITGLVLASWGIANHVGDFVALASWVYLTIFIVLLIFVSCVVLLERKDARLTAEYDKHHPPLEI